MAQFDYYPRAHGSGYWLDCQTDLMEHYDTRFVIPLVPLDEAPDPPGRVLNPQFEIGGLRYSLLTQFAGTIPASELERRAGSLERRRYDILNALDFLLTGV
jgi:toxin CcdB